MKKEETMRNLFLILAFAITTSCIAQKENRYIDKGNKAFENNNYTDAENDYKTAITENPESVAGKYNLGNTYYKQQNFEESLKQYQAIAKTSLDPGIRSKAYHNMGNAYMEMQDYEKSVNAYKNALKSNPNDMDTKYNLAYALSKLKQEQQQQQQNQDDKNQDKKDQDKQDKQNQDQQNQDDKNKDQQDKNKQDQQNQEQQNKDEQQQKTQPKKYTPEELERIMQTLNNQDKKIQDKVNQQKTQPVRVQGEKDW
ncbi:MAG: tetratricopeptide repeat protein [Chitinophagales bacterium]|nr:tetratricopeptide repeat protein [Chitinophagales bacterium]MBP8754521.1 tetratricopeptide repeat protein [Chitinophagales bacterium]